MSDEIDTVELATDLTVAWLSNPNTRTSVDEVPAFLKSMFDAVSGLGGGDTAQATPVEAEHVPAVSIRKSLAARSHIVSLIDGKPYKTLRRHLTKHGLTPDDYRRRYGLKADYPMTAPDYSEARSATARRIGLGRKVEGAVAKAVDAVEKAVSPKRARKSPTAAKAAARDHLQGN